MEVTSSIESPKKLQQPIKAQDSAASDDTEQNDDVPVESGSFDEFMRSALGGPGRTEVNEEELFAALIGQRLEQESPEAAAFYRGQKDQFMSSLRRADGYVSVEEAAVKALKSTLEAGHIDAATAERVNGEAFAAAQLDDNKEALFDSFGSAEDATMAVSSMEAALLAMRTMVEQIDAGELSVTSRSLDAPMTTTVAGSGGADGVDGAAGGGGPAPEGGQHLDGSGGFLWKPESENDGNLVVLLPTSLKGMIDRVEIHSQLPPEESTKLGSGRFTGDTHNGGRAHFRFDKPGEAYGDNVHLVVFKDDGSTVSWEIGNGGERHD